MRGMDGRTTYWFNGENYDRTLKKEQVKVVREGVLIDGTLITNGNRIASSRIIRPVPVPEPPMLQYKVTGWDMQMNTIRKTVPDMEQAIDLALTLLGGSARIRPVKKGVKRGTRQTAR